EHVARVAGEGTAQQVLDAALALHQVSKMILGAPRSCSQNATRRCRALQVVRAQPLKKRHNLRLRRCKGVQNLCASWHDNSPRNQWAVGVRGTIGSTRLEHELLRAAPAYSRVNSFQCPSETTSTAPSTTCMAV